MRQRENVSHLLELWRLPKVEVLDVEGVMAWPPSAPKHLEDTPGRAARLLFSETGQMSRIES
jgi:hypothetical protein